MKKRYIAVAVIVAIVLLLPKYIATQVTSSITDLVASINKMPVYSAQVVEINEGWFSSNAIIKVGINFDDISVGQIDLMSSGEAQFLIDFKSAHGPVIMNDGFAVALAKWQATYAGNELKPIMQWDHSRPFYQISGIQQLGNVTQYDDQLQAFTIDHKGQNIQANFTGNIGKGTLSNDHFDYSSSIDKITIQNNDNSAVIADVEIDMSVEGNYLAAMEGKLFDTDIVTKIGQLQLIDLINQSEVINLLSTNLAVVASLDKDNGTADISQRFDVKSASFNGYQIENLKTDLAVNRLSLKYIEEYQNMANQLSGQDPLIVQQEMAKFALNNMLELLKNEPEVNLKNVSATLPEGKFDINAKVQSIEITTLPDNLEDPEFWLSHLLAEANLHSDKAVAEMFATNYVQSQIMKDPQAAEMSLEQINQIATEQAPAILDALIQQGLIVEENDIYKATATLKDKQAMLNGKPIPLPF